MEVVFILLIVGLLYFGYRHMDKNSSFDIKSDGVYFGCNKKQVPYNHIISIERDMTNSFEGKKMYFAYVITFFDQTGKKDSFRFYKALTDAGKWELLKSRIKEVNPFVKINENTL